MVGVIPQSGSHAIGLRKGQIRSCSKMDPIKSSGAIRRSYRTEPPFNRKKLSRDLPPHANLVTW
jgi:hypothetical protein